MQSRPAAGCICGSFWKKWLRVGVLVKSLSKLSKILVYQGVRNEQGGRCWGGAGEGSRNQEREQEDVSPGLVHSASQRLFRGRWLEWAG